jgi:glucose dehydrogenase
MWGATIFDQLACRIEFHQLRYEGIFTPPSLQGTLVFPGDLGIFEWGGIAVDPVRQIAIANPIAIPFVSKLLPRGADNPPAPARERGRRTAYVWNALRHRAASLLFSHRPAMQTAPLGLHGRD